MIRNVIKKVLSSPSFSSLAAFAGSNILIAIITGVTGLIQARWLSPEIFGEYRKYTILATYLMIGYSFVHDGLIRQYPYLIGKGQIELAHRTAAVAKWWYCFICRLYVILFVFLSVYAAINGDWRGAAGWGTQIFNVIVLIYGAYQGVMYRTSSDFKRLAANGMISCVVGTVSLLFVRLFGYWGCLLRFCVVSIVSWRMNERYLPVKVKGVFSWRELLSLAKISLRFSIPGYLHSSALIASINSAILLWFGQGILGLFGIAITLQGFALTFTNALNQIFNVKVTSYFGKTEDVRATFRYAIFPTALSVCLSFVFYIVGYFSIEPFIRLVLPEYLDAVPLIRVLLVALVLKAMSLPLLVINAALMYWAFLGMAAVQFFSTVCLAYALPRSPVNVATASILGSAVAMLFGYGCVFLKMYKKR